MKNIYLLPTTRPSKLFIHNAFNDLRFDVEQLKHDNNQHIYIISDEEIKVGDWCISKINNKIFKKEKKDIIDDLCNKILLTTDQDLIKDGVQVIDDEFLEWFVKNPSCESVEYNKNYNRGNGKYYYKIIIPQEEPKQETLEEAAKEFVLSHDFSRLTNPNHLANRCFQYGAKWQQERMYSEAIEFAEWIRIKDFQTASKDNWIGLDMKYYTTQELFEQFKNK
jgi:hypothetical protein